jgi:hypothetical protein
MRNRSENRLTHCRAVIVGHAVKTKPKCYPERSEAGCAEKKPGKRPPITILWSSRLNRVPQLL